MTEESANLTWEDYMGKSVKLEVMHRGGIAIVSTPHMEYMARTACNELRGFIRRRAVDFHVIDFHGFSRGEALPQITKNVRLKNVYLFYDFNGDAGHDSFMLQMVIAALQDGGCESVSLVMPYMPYLRQDRKDRSRVPISAKVFIGGYERFEKAERTITLDMHADQTQAVFDKRSDHLPGHVIFVPWIKRRFDKLLNDIVIVAPDAGSEKRVNQVAKRVGCERAFLTKERAGSSVEITEVYGADVKDKICIINDDIMDTCSTVIKGAKVLMESGAREVILTATHAVFGDKGGTTAYQKLKASGLHVVVTDSLRTKKHDWLTVLPLGRYLGHAILQNNIVDGSISHIIEHGLPPR